MQTFVKLKINYDLREFLTSNYDLDLVYIMNNISYYRIV